MTDPAGPTLVERCAEAADMTPENGWMVVELRVLVGTILAEFMAALREPAMVRAAGTGVVGGLARAS